jgi:hypothetical protein
LWRELTDVEKRTPGGVGAKIDACRVFLTDEIARSMLAFDQGDDVTNRYEARCLVLANLASELVLEQKENLDEVETVGVQVFEEARVRDDDGGVNGLIFVKWPTMICRTRSAVSVISGLQGESVSVANTAGADIRPNADWQT